MRACEGNAVQLLTSTRASVDGATGWRSMTEGQRPRLHEPHQHPPHQAPTVPLHGPPMRRRGT